MYVCIIQYYIGSHFMLHNTADYIFINRFLYHIVAHTTQNFILKRHIVLSVITYPCTSFVASHQGIVNISLPSKTAYYQLRILYIT